MDMLIKSFGKLLIWLPLLAAAAEILGVVYFWLVQYELDVTVGQINGGTNDVSRTQLWPALLIALAVLDVAISIWLYKRQRSAQNLRLRTEILIVSITFVLPMVIFGGVGLWQMHAALSNLGQGLQPAGP